LPWKSLSGDVTYSTVVHHIRQRFFVLSEVPRSYASNYRSISIFYR
jgi:hypothetical protein